MTKFWDKVLNATTIQNVLISVGAGAILALFGGAASFYVNVATRLAHIEAVQANNVELLHQILNLLLSKG